MLRRLLLCGRSLIVAAIVLCGALSISAADSIGKSSEIRDQTTGNGALFKLHDNGDGTVALSIYGVTGSFTLGAALPAGTAIIGKVGIDQTTPGTTNKVNIGTDGTVVATPPTVTAGNDATQSAATGTNWTALASHTAKQVTIINTTGTAISVRYGSSTGISLPDGSGYTFRGLTNSTGLQVKRTDDSNTQVSVAYNYETW